MHGGSPQALAVVAALVGLVLVRRHVWARARKRRHLRFAEQVARRHLTRLAVKRRQLATDDGYGNQDLAAWREHAGYFVDNVILREARARWRLRGAEASREAMLARVLRLVEAHAPEVEVRPGAAMSGRDYEALCAGLLERHGWQVRSTPATGDQGADLIGETGGTIVVFQCKFHAKPVGNKAVQEAVAALPFHGADRAAVVSNAPYTRSARQLARSNGVLLLHHDELAGLAERLSEHDGADHAVPSARNSR